MARKLTKPERKIAWKASSGKSHARNVPDLNDPKVRADLRRQGRLLARHAEIAEIDAWIEAAYDWSEWK
jgi:Protein  of unknown function (DUF3018)